MTAHKSNLSAGRGHSYGALLLVLLAVPVIFIYADALTGPFIFDDKIHIQENPHIRIPQITFKGLATAAFDSPLPRRPVAYISFALNYYLHGDNVVGFRLLNIIIHVISGILLYFFIQAIPVFLLYLICLGIGIFVGAVAAIGFITNKELFPVSIAGTATGLVNFFPFLGGAVFQVILGTVLDSQGVTASGGFAFSGFRYCFLVLFGCGLVALVASFFLKETMHTD